MELTARTAPLAVLLFVTALAPPLGAQANDPATGARSVLDGAFTDAQAERGRAAFRRHCAECHTASEFTGWSFLYSWAGRTMGDLFETVRSRMPFDNPGSLTRDTYADVLAYVLHRNGLPSGRTELPSDDAALRAIRIERQPTPER